MTQGGPLDVLRLMLLPAGKLSQSRPGRALRVWAADGGTGIGGCEAAIGGMRAAPAAPPNTVRPRSRHSQHMQRASNHQQFSAVAACERADASVTAASFSLTIRNTWMP